MPMQRQAYGMARAGILFFATLMLTACAQGAGPFQPDPLAGFPPSFTEPPYTEYRAKFVADRARFDADSVGFMRGASVEACSLSPEAQKRFAHSAFIAQPEHTTPTWDQVKAGNAPESFAPIIDQAEVRVLEGRCDGGTVSGIATLHARFLRVKRSDVMQLYEVSEVEILETCSYVDLERTGLCNHRYETIRTRIATMSSDGALSYSASAPEERAVVFDYGNYAEGRTAAPGVVFATTKTLSGLETNKTIARRASGDRIRYAEYTGGGPAHTFYYRRISDGKLHGAVTQGGMELSCYEDGIRIIRGGACQAQ
jgi:hypothetical protein